MPVSDAKIQKLLDAGATPEQITAGLTQRGETERLARFQSELGAEPAAPVAEPPGMMRSMMEGGLQGASFGFADEIEGAGRSLFSDMTYDEARDAARERAAASAEANPGSYYGGMIGSSFLIPGLGGIKAATTLAPKMGALGRLATTGGIEGGVAGYGESEEETLGGQARDVAESALTGGIMSPAMGGAATIAGKGLRAGGNLLGTGGRIARNLASSDVDVNRAQGLVRNAARQDHLTAKDVREFLDTSAGVPAAADMGENLRGLSMLAGNQPGTGRTQARDFLEGRQRGARARIGALAKETLGPEWTDFHDMRKTLGAERKAQAAPLYESAYQTPLARTPRMEEVLATDDLQKALKKAQKEVTGDLDIPAELRAAAAGGEFNTPLAHSALRTLDDRIGAAVRKGKNSTVRRLTKLKRQLRNEVFEQNPDFKEAQNIWAGGAAYDNAAQKGRKLFTGKQYADDLAEEFVNDFTPPEREAFKTGLLRGIEDQTLDVNVNASQAGSLVRNERNKELINLAFEDDKEGFERLLSGLGDEATQKDTYNAVFSGSRTAPFLQQQQDAAAVTAAGDLASGSIPGVIQAVARWATDPRMTEGTAAEISRVLFNPDISDRELRKIFGNLRSEAVSRGLTTARESAVLGLTAAGAPSVAEAVVDPVVTEAIGALSPMIIRGNQPEPPPEEREWMGRLAP